MKSDEIVYSVFGIPLTTEESLAFKEGKDDYEIMFWRGLNLIADDAAVLNTVTMTDVLCDGYATRGDDPVKRENAWRCAVWFAMFSQYAGVIASTLKWERLLDGFKHDKKRLYMWATYILRKPNPIIYAQLLGTEFAAQYRNHAAFYIYITPDENHSLYSTVGPQYVEQLPAIH